jgi:hypothetical protein
MFFLPRDLDPKSGNRRVTRRVVIESTLACNLGRVLDLSAGGLSVIARKPLEGIVLLQLGDEDGGIRCEVKVIRSRRLGFFRHEIGLQLPPLSDGDRATLTRLCSAHRDRRFSDAA